MKQKDNYQPSAIFFHTLFGWSLTLGVNNEHILSQRLFPGSHQQCLWKWKKKARDPGYGQSRGLGHARCDSLGSLVATVLLVW
jgi:pyrroloquinoline quinone (PQQ) biosynthesis protein C